MTINVAQLGVGYWGPNLLRNLMVNKACIVKRVVDLSPERRDYVERQYPNIDVSERVDDIMEDPDIAAVVIATPVATHYDLAMKAIEAGKHILVEKPMARAMVEIEAIGAAAKKKNVVAMSGHTFLFNAAVRYVKELIDSGELGEIRYIYSRRLNLGRIRSDVDALWNLAPHDVSIVQFWLGDPEPTEVIRMGVDYIQNGIDDVVFMNIRYPGKTMANIHVSWLDPHRVRSMVVVGSKKMVTYDDTAENKIAIYDKGIDQKAVLGEGMDFDNQHFPTFNHRSGDVYLPKIEFQEPLKEEVQHFMECIEGRISCIAGIEHTKNVVAILERASRK